MKHARVAFYLAAALSAATLAIANPMDDLFFRAIFLLTVPMLVSVALERA